MSDYEEIEYELRYAKRGGCTTCDKSVMGRPDISKNYWCEGPGSCWFCRRLSNWKLKGKLFVITPTGYDYLDNIEPRKNPMTKQTRPKWTIWNPKTVHNDIKGRVRSKRRIFKQYLRTGSLRLLQAAERKITSWDFD